MSHPYGGDYTEHNGTDQPDKEDNKRAYGAENRTHHRLVKSKARREHTALAKRFPKVKMPNTSAKSNALKKKIDPRNQDVSNRPGWGSYPTSPNDQMD